MVVPVLQRCIFRGISWLICLMLPCAIGCREEADRSAEGGNASTAVTDAAQDWLVDVTADSGIRFVHDPVARGEYLFPEITGSGCGLLDYDNDGFLDVYLVQGGRDLREPGAAARPNMLFRNRGDGTFEDVTSSSGAGDTGYGQGMAVGDFDNDGFVDLYVSNVGDDALLRNNGDGTFMNVTAKAGISNPAWSIASGFLDYDRDGDLDLYVSNYVRWSVETDRDCERYGTGRMDYCGPQTYEPAPDMLYRNNGDGTFSDVTAEVGLAEAFGPAMSVICADLDDDGYPDVYVANDSVPNQLWRNLGGNRFEDVAGQRGAAVNAMGKPEGSMGCNAEDFDRDGVLDLFMCHFYFETNTLYLNRGGRVYEDVTVPSGLGRFSLNRTGFGASTLHLFNDATMYLYVGNGAVHIPDATPPDPQRPRTEYDQLLQWDDKTLRFSDVSEKAGKALHELAVTRGVAVGDYDNDGDPDLLLSGNGGAARLLRNDAGNGQHWLQVHCRGRGGMRDALGAKVFVTVGGKTCRRDVIVNYSYGSSCDPRVHFGLGEHDSVERVVVRWPDGSERTMENVPADRVLEVEPN